MLNSTCLLLCAAPKPSCRFFTANLSLELFLPWDYSRPWEVLWFAAAHLPLFLFGDVAARSAAFLVSSQAIRRILAQF
jgi:hypothetical protein